ncbi:hypothetical protein [Mucilaginibacter lacusdianchii]|uniref:hypothetical protein n=1 Tax=Mucilaginibacter lacusdianchii TaxID=2684211 RepID=UPI00131C7446|nr:hypothetical protein [Mucilaginibacter sp. JXJ CY 39]
MIRQTFGLLILFLGILLFFFVFPYFNNKNLGCREKDELFAEEFSAKVKEKLIDSGNHNFPKIVLSGDDRMPYRYFTSDIQFPNFYQSIQIGDSLYKIKKTLFYIVVSKNGKRKRLNFHSLCGEN